MTSLLEAVLAGAVVGLALGLTGGGGSILAVPLLIYALGLPAERAVPISLVAVAITAFVGAVEAMRRRLVVWQPVIIFALGGVVGAPLGILAGRQVPERLILAGFALLALVVGTIMWRSTRIGPTQAAGPGNATYEVCADPVCILAPDGQLRFTAPCAVLLAVIGLGTGFLSGLFGVGGGFLIVPTLTLVTRIGVHRAIATSLLIVTAIGTSGAASALWHSRLDWGVLLPFVLGGGAAMILGRKLAGRLAGPRLQRTFAIAVVAVGLGMLLDSVI